MQDKENSFYPDSITVTPTSSALEKTGEIIEKIQAGRPDVRIIKSENQLPGFPYHFTDTDKFRHLKKNIILGTRTDSFVETFASPGSIVEEPGINVKTVFQCPSECEYCYLQKSALMHPYQRIYTNTAQIEMEMLNELVLYPAFLSILSTISYHRKRPLLKIPPKFKEVTDQIRDKLSQCGRKYLTKEYVLAYFNSFYPEILSQFGIQVQAGEVKRLKDEFREFYELNKEYPLWFNLSEYTDIVAVEHMTGHLKMFMNLVKDYEDIRIKFFTKSPANLESLLSLGGCGRVNVVLNLSTDYVQRRYEHGTADLDERMRMAELIQRADGFLLTLHFEPMISYEGYIDEYTALLRNLLQTLDPEIISGINLGSIRYAEDIKDTILSNYPETDLFNTEQKLLKPQYDIYDRLRYSMDERIKIYSAMITEIRKYGDISVRFGAETPELFYKMGFNAAAFISQYFHQFEQNIY